jgi:hypothetical protein
MHKMLIFVFRKEKKGLQALAHSPLATNKK